MRKSARRLARRTPWLGSNRSAQERAERNGIAWLAPGFVTTLAALAWLAMVTVPASARAEVHTYRLDNGMKVIVKPDHRAPVVVSQVWYKVGGSYENDGLTGISHVLEHMMFKGTPRHPAGEFSRLIAQNGGRENAFTGRDYTAYFQTLAKDKLPLSLALESDRMHNLTLPPKEFRKELQVVMEERRMRTEDKPRALTSEALYATAFMNNPYHHPIIGWRNDLENMTDADLRQWYRRWYAPNNATLVVVGDVDPDAVYHLAKQYFGPIPAATVTPPKPRHETPQRGLRQVTVAAPAELPYLLMGYKVPVLKTASADWEPYALEVLAGILDGGDSARFPRDLIRGRQIAAQADVGYDLYALHDDLFVIDATPAQGRSVAEVEQAVRKQIQRLRTQPVSRAELDRVKAQVVAGNVYQRDSMFYQGMQIGMLETVGLGWQRLDEYVKRIEAVTPEQVRAVARKYLHDDGLTIATLKPLPLDSARAPSAMPGGRHDMLR